MGYTNMGLDNRATTELDKVVGNNIFLRRQSEGFTRYGIAEKFGVSHQAFHKYETGAAKVSATGLYRLSRILGCTVDDFFVGYGEEVKNSGKRKPLDIVRKLHLLKQEHRVLIDQIIDALLETDRGTDV